MGGPALERGLEAAAGFVEAGPGSSGRPEGAPGARDVVEGRAGGVLGRGAILKNDHFPGCQNLKLRPLLDGAPNFRGVPGLPVYGVGVPTAAGLRAALDELVGPDRGRPVLWHNMREEPLLYINGSPFVVREAERPFANLEYSGIDRGRVEGMEARLKQDALAEASLYGNAIMVSGETDGGDLVELWEAVTPVDVQTPREVFQELAEYGYSVDYLRIPVTDERAPDRDDCDTIVLRSWDAPEDAVLVFNCQMGRGRTSTGMVIATMALVRRAGLRGQEALLPPWALAHMAAWEEGGLSPSGAGSEPLSPERARADSSDTRETPEEELKRGNFGVVRSLVRVLERGTRGKAHLDAAIDACAAMQNLREAISSYRRRLLDAGDDKVANRLQGVCLDYLERYFVLITLSTYLLSDSVKRGGVTAGGYEDWMESRSELSSVLTHLLKRNPMGALEIVSKRSPSHDDLGHLSSVPGVVAPEQASFIVSVRAGSVLGPRTILKEDHFPGLQSENLTKIPGAPNFRQAAQGVPVYGLAIPTLDGIKSVLKSLVGDQPAEPCGAAPPSARVLWYNLREECVVYINGSPYVLREELRPYKNLQEYTDIATERVEGMEARLKEDIISEVAANQGCILVTREFQRPTGNRVNINVWEKLDGWEAGVSDEVNIASIRGDVLTPREVYGSLLASGQNVQYVRLPMTDGMAPRAVQFDAIYSSFQEQPEGTRFVFNCQAGSGRTTTGTVIATLIHLARREGTLLGLKELKNCVPLGRKTSVQSYIAGGPDTCVGSSVIRRAESAIDKEAAAALYMGEYSAARRLTVLLKNGMEIKSSVDMVIDSCGALKNLREAIFDYRQPSVAGQSWGDGDDALHLRDASFRRGIEYLERYLKLIVFAAWLNSRGSGALGAESFQGWYLTCSDLQQLKKDVRVNPAAALAPPPTAELASHLGQPGTPKRSPAGLTLSESLLERRGQILNSYKILKNYQMPSVSRAGFLEPLQGVQNFYWSETMPVCSSACPTVSGLRGLFDMLGASEAGAIKVVVIDLREELSVYVGGRPYCLRDLHAPASNLHHAGISSRRMQSMEVALREDVQAEARHFQGSVVAHFESQVEKEIPEASNEGSKDTLNPSRRSSVITRKFDEAPGVHVEARWEAVPGPKGDVEAGICTPSEVYSSLSEQGYAVSYARVPLSRERTPLTEDLNLIHSCICEEVLSDSSGRSCLVMFQSLTGMGSSMRFAMAAAGLLLESKGHSGQLSIPAVESRLSERGTPAAPPSEELEIEHASIRNLVRVLPDGPGAASKVDAVIDKCKFGNIRQDIMRCSAIARASGGAADEKGRGDQARRFGLHYLQRYFFLVAYQGYLQAEEEESFSEWSAERKEIPYLHSQLSIA